MTFFVRYTSNPEADLERNFSFVGYMLFDTAEAALENIADLTGAAYESEDFDLESWRENNLHLVGQDNVTGKWGQKKSGLCGFGGFETVEEAREFSKNHAYAVSTGAIFEGTEVWGEMEEDETFFRATRIAEVF
jgi:hypothetical protein